MCVEVIVCYISVVFETQCKAKMRLTAATQRINALEMKC